MKDIGHEETDKLLEELEARLYSEYEQASIEVKAKLDDYLKRFKIKDKIKRRQLKEGKITQKQYNDWRIGQIAIGERWEEMVSTLATDFHNTNMIAKSITFGYMPEVYAINHNYATFRIEKSALVDTSYTLYDRPTVERLMKKNPDLLPPPGKKVSARIAAGEDIRWNKQQIQSVATQAILQGESIPQISKRLAETVGDSNYKAAVRNARTMTTSAENGGRQDAFKRAENMGIKMRRTWVATLDGRTRHAHRLLDGQTVDIDQPFTVDGEEIMFPGDPKAKPYLTWNCRCTTISQIKGFERDVTDLSLRHTKHLGDMTYEEWKNAKAKSNPILLPEEKAEKIKQSYIEDYKK